MTVDVPLNSSLLGINLEMLDLQQLSHSDRLQSGGLVIEGNVGVDFSRYLWLHRRALCLHGGQMSSVGPLLSYGAITLLFSG